MGQRTKFAAASTTPPGRARRQKKKEVAKSRILQAPTRPRFPTADLAGTQPETTWSVTSHPLPRPVSGPIPAPAHRARTASSSLSRQVWLGRRVAWARADRLVAFRGRVRRRLAHQRIRTTAACDVNGAVCYSSNF